MSAGCAIALASALTLFAPFVSAQTTSPEPPSSDRGASIAAETDTEAELKEAYSGLEAGILIKLAAAR